MDDKVATLRGLLPAMSNVYDPLGLGVRFLLKRQIDYSKTTQKQVKLG